MAETAINTDNDRTELPQMQARNLYYAGYTMAQISQLLGIKYHLVRGWKLAEDWDSASVIQKVESCVEARYVRLVCKANKTPKDLNEIKALGAELERAARIQRFGETGNGADLNPKLSKRRAGKTKPQSQKNVISEEGVQELNDAWRDELFGYQRKWAEARSENRIRTILKSRQIGATWYFAREALIDAVNASHNQIFLSASKAQAHVFKQYILQFVRDVTGVELKGDPITLWNGATLYFLGTNSKTAQSYHGHLYMDEFFWIQKFAELRKVASGMAMHKTWRQTYISTPSTITHEAYPFWTGEHFNKGRKKSDHIHLDVSHGTLAEGALGADGQWRQIVTIEDAVRGGCDLFDLDQLKLEYSEHDYNNLLMCQFVNDLNAVFSLVELQKCMVDSWERWDDYTPLVAKPLGNKPVWIGYDPARSIDNASVVVIAPPGEAGGKFRALEKHSWNGLDFDNQAKAIRALTQRYNVTHIGIDTSGMGLGVFELVKQFFPAAKAVSYSVEVKNRLVLKAKQIIGGRQFEFDSGWTDLAMAFLTIHRDATPSGRQISYSSRRTSETGHADLAWAVMHALDNEPLQSTEQTGGGAGGFIEMF